MSLISLLGNRDRNRGLSSGWLLAYLSLSDSRGGRKVQCCLISRCEVVAASDVLRVEVSRRFEMGKEEQVSKRKKKNLVSQES